MLPPTRTFSVCHRSPLIGAMTKIVPDVDTVRYAYVDSGRPCECRGVSVCVCVCVGRRSMYSASITGLWGMTHAHGSKKCNSDEWQK